MFMKKLLFLLSLITLCSCVTERDRDIRKASVMISYYNALIEYEDSVCNMPYDYRMSLRDSLQHWYDVRHNLIVNN